MAETLRALRGATTLDADTPEQMRERVQELVRTIMKENDVAADDIVSAIFTATDDLHSLFPATAARELGLDDVPFLGAQEVSVTTGVARCVRVMFHVYSTKSRSELQHVFLEGAASLRPDLKR